MARIIELIPGQDGKIRIVKLKTQHGTVLRPVQRVYPLEIHANENCVTEEVADMLFLQGISVLFKVSALLLKVHQAQILKCNSFESIVSFLKATLPSSGHVGMEKVLDQVLSMDVEKSLLTYQIEYMVLKEEMSELNNDSETTSSMRAQVENENKDLQKQNMELTEQLQVALNTVSRLEASVTSYQSTIRKLESHVRTLQDERDAMHHSVNILRKRLDSLDLGSPPSEPELANQLDVKNVKK
ncbi:TBC1 domain family member 1 [Trichonephila clavipes]|nr:TBC1 domain family member 1 [Trichonephila clavipes]